MRMRRQGSEDTSISFLDVICCGFGAIVLLMMITRTVPPSALENVEVPNNPPVGGVVVVQGDVPTHGLRDDGRCRSSGTRRTEAAHRCGRRG